MKHKIKYILMFIPFYCVLRWMIADNYKKREKGMLPDKWYWADRLCCNWGHLMSWH